MGTPAPVNTPSGSHRRKAAPYRTFVQIFFLLLVVAVTTAEPLSKAGIVIPLLSSASLHAICPFGGVVTLWQLLTEGTFVQKIHSSSLILMSAVLMLGLLFGPVFCGWACPLGSVQEWLGRIGKKIFKKRWNTLVPEKLDKLLRYLRYLLLILVVVNTAISGKLMFQEIDPYHALFSFWTGEVAITAYAVLFATLLLSLVIERPWCKYACPYGAFLGLTNLVRLFPIRRKASTCIHCKACDRACPMNIRVSGASAVRDHQCISCMKCTSEDACPIQDTVYAGTKGEKT